MADSGGRRLNRAAGAVALVGGLLLQACTASVSGVAERAVPTAGTAVGGSGQGSAPSSPPGPSRSATPQPVAPSTAPGGRPDLVVGLPGVPQRTDPLIDPDLDAERVVWRQVFQTLTNREGLDPAPRAGLAVSWRADDDYREWRLELAPGRTFHDGTAVTAEVVCANVAGWQRTASRGQSAWFDHWFGSGDESDLTGCRADGDRGVELSFTVPYPELPDLLAAQPLSIRAAASLDGGAPVGSGPYRWVSADTDTVDLEAVAATDGPRRVRFTALDDEDALAQALRSGEVDLTYGASSTQRAPAGARSLVMSADSQVQLVLRGAAGPLADPQLRAAVATVLDRAAVARRSGQEPAGSAFPAALRLAAADLPQGDVAAATALLRQRTPTLTLVHPELGWLPDEERDAAESVRRELTAHGVRVVVREADDDELFGAPSGATPAPDLVLLARGTLQSEPVEFVGIFHSESELGPLLEHRTSVLVDGLLPRVGGADSPGRRQHAAAELAATLTGTHQLVPLFDVGIAWWVGPRIERLPSAVFDEALLDGVRLR